MIRTRGSERFLPNNGLLLSRKTLPAGRRRLGGRGAGPQAAQAVSGLLGFERSRIAGDQGTQLADSGIPLVDVNERISLLELRGGGFVAAGILLDHFVVVLHRLLIVPLLVLNIRDVVLRVSRQIGVAVILDVIGELLSGEVVLRAVVVAERIVVQ